MIYNGEDFVKWFSKAYKLSKSTIKNLLQSGGLYINDIRLTENRNIEGKDFLYDKYCVLRKGKRDYFILIKP